MARKRSTKGGAKRSPTRSPRQRPRLWPFLLIGAVALAGLAWWRLSPRPAPSLPGAAGSGLDPQEAYRTALALGRQGLHLESIPYFRQVVRQYPSYAIAHENLGSALGNGAQQVRTHLGKIDNANRSTVERIALLKETLAELEKAQQYSRTDLQRAYAMLEQSRSLYTWGFPIDALARLRAAYAIAPENPAVVRSIQGLERELATGKRP